VIKNYISHHQNAYKELTYIILMAKRSRRSSGDDLALKLLDNSTIHKAEYHGPRSSSEGAITTPHQRKALEAFSDKYRRSLSNKCIPQRTAYIISELEKAGYKTLEETDGISITEFLKDDLGEFHYPPGTKFYLTFQDDVVIAANIGKKSMQEGVQFGFAHTDSPYLLGTGRFMQRDGLVYMATEPFGGIRPETWTDRQLSLFFKGTRKGRNGRRERVSFSIGDNPGDPSFTIPRECFHLEDEDEELMNDQLKVLLGNTPYKGNFSDHTKAVLLETMRVFNEKYGLRERDFKLGQTHIFPSEEARFTGQDGSMISGFGQDDWACAAAMLEGFVETKNPTYTSVLQLHPGEEVGDNGRGTTGAGFLGEIFTPALGQMQGNDLGEHYEGLLASQSLWADVIEVRHDFSPEFHDENDSAFLGAGPILIRQNGDEANYSGWRSSPDTLSYIDSFMEANNIPYQVATMGHSEERIPGASAEIHQAVFADGVDLAIPIAGMHSMNETVSAADVFLFSKAAKAYFSIKNRKKHMPIDPKS
tara:strand:+ start:17820 stop:19418 length:1599 start_codon:yes stop_codon:yes gene_type:complete